jgi:two-component system sensor histidine kinase MprB
MTFRLRLTLLAALAVAVALVGASLIVYYSYRHDSMRQVDSELGASLTLAPLDGLPSVSVLGGERFRDGPTNYGALTLVPVRVILPHSATTVEVRVNPANLSASYIESVGQYQYRTVDVDGVPTRQLQVLGTDSIVTVRRSLVDVDHSLSRLRWLLILTCLGGVGVATLLGALVSGRVIAPLRRLTETTERIAASGALSERTGAQGRDEIGRLSLQLDSLLASLEESLRTQRQLVADASHELRTPLASVRANVGLLARPDSVDPDERAELVADLEDELESMTMLVGELVELAHGEELDVQPVEFRLDEVVQSAVDTAVRRTPDLTIRTSLEPTTVVGIPERIERAVDNLLDNARKWSPAGEAIDVSLRGGIVEIRDRGPGIAAEDRPLVFNRFYRSAKARGAPGAGLGLAIVKQVADAHNGEVSVDEAPGGGALFRLSLPA